MPVNVLYLHIKVKQLQTCIQNRQTCTKYAYIRYFRAWLKTLATGYTNFPDDL